MRIAIGSDHAGYRYKTQLAGWLRDRGHQVSDFGTDSEAVVDYPDFVKPVARAVAEGAFDRGIVLGGSGQGEAMAANRFKGVRCALCWNVESARLARAHNDANMLALGQRLLSLSEALAIVEAWLAMPFEGERHQPRIAKLDQD
ncbi:MAG: ribose 5-phosphate isomerase B [Gemmatimonadales bacterium]